MRRISIALGMLGVFVSVNSVANSNHIHKSKQVYMDASVNSTNTDDATFLDYIFNSTNRPEWLTHTHASYAAQKHNTPIWEVETTQPFYQNCFDTVFGQARVASTSGNTVGNLGAGYRVLTDNNQMMWGMNIFGDETSQYHHSRIGIGGEMFTQYITMRVDYYQRLSATKTVSSSPGVATYERALNGYDLSIETPFPYLSWVRFVAQGYRYPGFKTGGANGGEVSFRIFPARQVEIDTGVTADNANGRMGFIKLDYYFGSPEFIDNTMTSPRYYGAYAPVNVEHQRLQKVVRHNDIVVEKSNSAEGESAGSVLVRGT